MADTTAKLFEPDALMPEQFFANLGRDAGGSNERGLMLAILRDAVECYQKYALSRDPRGRDLHDEAAEWIFSGDREWPFSFENICDVLGVSADYIRTGLAPLRQTAARRVRKAPRIVELSERRRDEDVDLDELDEEPMSKAG
ncbi:MAG TPA: hypothetical protein VEC57_18875 [Candidatus Limnocylindrales bacterium]|nr:hypothetical protein [Candidatus Limnocylindrales bacterium]